MARRKPSPDLLSASHRALAIVEQSRRVRLRALELLVEANVLADLNKVLVADLKAIIKANQDAAADDTTVDLERPTRYHGPQS